jgi:cell division protein FtsL
MARKYKIKQKWVAIGGTLFLVYIVVILSRVVWQNYQVNKQVDSLKNQIASLQQSNHDLQNEILYFQTDAYKEELARQQLNLQRPGEHVIIVPRDTSTNSSGEQTRGQPLPNWQQWWNFFFNPPQ